MKIRFSSLTFTLLAVFIVYACTPAPTASYTPTDVLASHTVAPTATVEAAATSTPESVIALTPTEVVQVQPIATSRGPNLEATDPTTVSLASGGLQLVEFFRFT